MSVCFNFVHLPSAMEDNNMVLVEPGSDDVRREDDEQKDNIGMLINLF
jgi:hypothetical protein